MLRIVTDGAADMPADWEEKYEIHILPLRVNFGDTTYVQGVNFKLEDFYRLVRETRIIPKTSLPSPGQVMEFYRGIANKGELDPIDAYYQPPVGHVCHGADGCEGSAG